MKTKAKCKGSGHHICTQCGGTTGDDGKCLNGQPYTPATVPYEVADRLAEAVAKAARRASRSTGPTPATRLIRICIDIADALEEYRKAVS